MRPVRLGVVLLFVTVSWACGAGGQVAAMASLYRKGRYSEAIDRALRAERDLGTLDARKQAHYFIYRGASHAALGQVDLARYWLDQAQRMRVQYPGVIEGDHALVLDGALSRLGAAPAAAPAATAAPATASDGLPPVVH